jgi:hypothetical protein
MRCLIILIGLSAMAFGTKSARAAEDDERIRAAIEKGVVYLKEQHKPRDGYDGGKHGIGSAALVGLALLESGVPADDAVIRNTTRFVRKKGLAEQKVYELAVALMYLDRLGDPSDRYFIQLMAVRLMAGQAPTGGWSYMCGAPISATEETRMRTAFKNAQLKSPEAATQPPKDDSPKKNPKNGIPARNNEQGSLHPEIVRWARLIDTAANPDPLLFAGGDNSNTQFAVLALWCARKHGVPCDAALVLAEKRFRTTQNNDAGWGYMPPSLGIAEETTPTMTCAGIVSLAVGVGVRESTLRSKTGGVTAKGGGSAQPAFIDDRTVARALKFVGDSITKANGRPPSGRVDRSRKDRVVFKPNDLSNNLYLLWSIERIGVICGLDTIGNHDWYSWGADALLATQKANGSWDQREYTGAYDEANTCFALLFLNRANAARDLTATLKGRAKEPLGVPADKKDPPAVIVEPMPMAKDPATEPMVVRDFEADAKRWTDALVNAPVADRGRVLVLLRDTRGSVNTEALARAAAKMTGEAQQEVRDALARRLTRMTAATLRAMLIDENREIRIAAAIACGLKKDKQFVPDLIGVLTDADQFVSRAAKSSLKALTEKDFGPEDEPTASEKKRAAVAWFVWWKSQSK